MMSWYETKINNPITLLYYVLRQHHAKKHIEYRQKLSLRSLLKGELIITQKPNDIDRMKTYRDQYKGKRCFIIGNGPSLNLMDLSFLKNEITIGANGVYEIFAPFGFLPTFLFVEDLKSAYRVKKKFNTLKGTTKFAAIYNAFLINHDNETLYYKTNYPVSRYEMDNYPRMFSKSFHDIAFLGGSITYISLQFAYYLGFDEVYIIGVDHGYGKRFDEKHHLNQGKAITLDEEDIQLLKSSHASKNYLNYKVGSKLNILDYSVSNESYKVALNAFTSEGRKIFNAGIHSNLNIFPFADYSSLFKIASNP